MIKIIHISDFHLNSESLSFDEGNLVKSLHKDLKNYIDEKTIIIFTGDALNEGGRNFEDTSINPFNYFKKVLFEPLISEYPFLQNKIFIIPGNHDIQRQKIRIYEDEGLKVRLKKDYSDVSQSLLGNIIEHERLELYKDFENLLYQSNPTKIDYNGIENTFKFDIDKESVGISCINSAWLCKDDNDFKNIAICESQIERSLLQLDEVDIRICIFHHPLDFLLDIDKERIKPIIFSNYDILLTGHTHKVEGMHATDFDGQIYYSVGKALKIHSDNEAKYETGYIVGAKWFCQEKGIKV